MKKLPLEKHAIDYFKLMREYLDLAKAVRLLVAALLIGSTGAAFAACSGGKGELKIHPVPSLSLGTWDDAGTVATDNLFCIQSSKKKSTTNSNDFCPYEVEVRSSDGANQFYLYLDNDNSNTGDNRILVTLQHRDILDGNVYEILSEDVFESQSHYGQGKNCNQNGDNSQLRVEISGTELSGKTAGTYTGNFELRGEGGVNFKKKDDEDFSISINVSTSDPQVQISGLDDFVLGDFNGSGNVTASDSFCAYAESTGYRISVSGNNQDQAGNYFLSSAAGNNLLPVQLAYAANGTGPGTINLTGQNVTGLSGSSTIGCNDTNNATLTLSIDEQDLRSATSGTYTETLILLMEPE